VPVLTQFADTTNGNFFSSLGIDWQMLIVQIVAFLILVWVLGKWVYPWLIKQVDDRKDRIDAADKAAAEAKKAAEEAAEKTEQLLEDARKQAGEIIETARQESQAIAADSAEKARAQADNVIKEASEQLGKDIESARQTLRSETLDLVALATAKVSKAKIDAKADAKLISTAIEEAARE